jgi:hypothetical protein
MDDRESDSIVVDPCVTDFTDAKPTESKTVPEALRFIADNCLSRPTVVKDTDASKWRRTVLWTEKVRCIFAGLNLYSGFWSMCLRVGNRWTCCSSAT